MTQFRKIVLVLGKINTMMAVLALYFASHKKMHLLFGIALAISLAYRFDDNDRAIIPHLQNTIQSDSLASYKSTFRKEVKVGNHEFVFFVK
ncbi:MAG TPA: hypothetical protein VGQ59_01730 [Cyclobacteriaceae bacterium]|jgi:hypothetical protein|nr:hypothetical protein [Cyclobacteriaceae bacterium]